MRLAAGTLLFVASPLASAARPLKLDGVLDTAPPRLDAVLAASGWEPAPERSGAFLPGRVFVPEGAAHVLASADCVDSGYVTATYTGMELVTQLQAGVRVRAGIGSVSGEAGVVKSLRFSAPSHLSIPSLDLAPTPACRAQLERAALAGAYVVRESLLAEIAEQTCGRVDAEGRFAVFGQADAALARSCSRESLEPVVVAVRTVALADFLAAAVPPEAADEAEASAPQAAPALSSSAAGPVPLDAAPPTAPDGYLARVQAQAQAVATARAQLAELEAAQQEALDAAEAALLQEAADAFAALSAMHATDAAAARPLLEQFVGRYDPAVVTATLAGETVSRPVSVPHLADARAILTPEPDRPPPSPGRVLAETGMRMVAVEGPDGTLLVSDTEVLQGAYQAVMGSNPSEFYRCGADCPVEQVSWVEAVAFCNALSEAEGLTPAYAGAGLGTRRVSGADGYRLPTLPEWRVLTRGGTLYAGSDSVRNVAWTALNSDERTHAARGLRPTGDGIYDLSGNVAEWLDAGTAPDRLHAGGSWSEGPVSAAVRNTTAERAAHADDDLGFRVVREAPRQP